MRTTHTFAELEVSAATYIEIRDKLKVAGYEHAFIDGAIDMHGIGLTKEPEEAEQPEDGKFTMRMAKATSMDIDAAMDMASLVEALQKGHYPSDAEDAPTSFDEQDEDHLRFVYDSLMKIPRNASLFRVAFGMGCILDSNILDPDKDFLALHPRLQPCDQRPQPLDEYHEDYGPVVWWKFPVNEPSWIGTPTDSDWPGYHTHWTPHPEVPEAPHA